MSTNLPSIEVALESQWQAADWGSVPLVLAVSGGADSVALAVAMARVKQKLSDGRASLVVAHLDHGIRPGSARDAAFVAELAERLQWPFELGRISPGRLEGAAADGIEAAARQARYEFLLEAAERHSARYIVTAHTADDQVETILHRIVRGTGLRGLAGMPRVRALSPAVSLIRPLLTIRREEVLAYLAEREQPYCTDETNAELHFTRNRIRAELLPLLHRDYNRQTDEALLRLGTLAGEAQQVIDEAVAALAARCLRREASGATIVECVELGGASPFLVRELLVQAWRESGWPLQSMGYAQWDLLAGMIAGVAPSDTTLPGGIRAKKQGNQLWLVPLGE